VKPGKLASGKVKSTEAASPATRSPIVGPQAISALEAQQKEAAMQHVAIDLGGRESQICARSAQGEILLECKVPTAKLADYLKGQEPSRVVLETCAEAFRIADIALQCEHDVRVVPATLVRSLGVGARGVKTDRRDAQVLSEVSCRIELPSVHVPTDLARQRRSMCGMREELIRARTAIINCARGWARTQLLKVRSGTPKLSPNASRMRLSPVPTVLQRTLLACALASTRSTSRYTAPTKSFFNSPCTIRFASV
jgi:transposase